VDINYKRGESLRFKIKYEVRPEIQLKEYKGLKVEKLVHIVNEKEVESEFERLRQINRTTTEVETAVDDEHILTVDLQEVDTAGFPIVGKKNENVRVYLKDETVYPQLREALRNAERGKEYRAKYETMRGREREETNLVAKVKKVEKVTLPEFNDEFVKKITKGKVASTAQFRENVKKDLEEFWKQESGRKLQDAIVGEILKRHDFTVPEGMIKYFLDTFLEEVRQQHPGKKLPENFNEEEFRKENRAYAIYQARWLLLRDKIIETENIVVTDAELEQLAESESQKIGIEKARLLNYYKTSKAASSRLLSDKLMSFLKDHAVIKEKVVEEARAA
jgi:trigger factor